MQACGRHREFAHKIVSLHIEIRVCTQECKFYMIGNLYIDFSKFANSQIKSRRFFFDLLLLSYTISNCFIFLRKHDERFDVAGLGKHVERFDVFYLIFREFTVFGRLFKLAVFPNQSS